MPYLRDQVIILKKIPVREYDRTVFMYGRQHGLLVATARGAARPKSKQAARLEPLTYSEVMIAKGSSFDHLAVASATTGPSGPSSPSGLSGQMGRGTCDAVRCSLSLHAVGGAFADMFVGLVRPGVADERLFVLWEELSAALSGLEGHLTPLRGQLMFAAASLKLMDLLGYGPALSVCAACRQPSGPTDAWYAPQDGGLVCAACRGSWAGALVPANAHALSLLRFARQAPLADVLRVSLPVEVGMNALRLIREVWKHAPLDREPHGLETIGAILA